MGKKPWPGVISANEIYTLDEFERRSGLGKAATREARRSGLKVRRIELTRPLGLRSYVLGSDWIEYVRQHGLIVGPQGDLSEPEGN